MENLEDAAAVNSELRFLTLELMKIASDEKRTFEEVLDEYFENTYKLKRRLLVAFPDSYSSRKPARNQLRKARG